MFSGMNVKNRVGIIFANFFNNFIISGLLYFSVLISSIIIIYSRPSYSKKFFSIFL